MAGTSERVVPVTFQSQNISFCIVIIQALYSTNPRSWELNGILSMHHIPLNRSSKLLGICFRYLCGK